MLDFIYADEKPLTPERLQPFHSVKKTRGELVESLLAEISQLDIYHQTYPPYKETLFNKVMGLIKRENFTSISIEQSANALYYMTIMLTTDLNNIDFPEKELHILYGNVFYNRTHASPRSISLTLWSVTKLAEQKNFNINYKKLKRLLEQQKTDQTEDLAIALYVRIQPTHLKNIPLENNDAFIKKLFDKFYLKRKDATVHEIIFVLSSLALHLENDKSLDYFNENHLLDLMDLVIAQFSEARSDEKEYLQTLLPIFFQNEKLSEAHLKNYTDYFMRLKENDNKKSLSRNSLPPILLEIASELKYRLNKDIFMRVNPALIKKRSGSNFHLRSFDLSEDDIQVILNYLSQMKIPYELKLDNFPSIEFQFENYFFQLSLDWEKLSPEETDDEAILRKIGSKNMTFDSFYVLLTGDSRQELELKSSDFHMSAFLQNRMGLQNREYFLEDPVRVLQWLSVSLEFPEFKQDAEVEAALHHPRLKNAILNFLKDSDNNTKRFSNALEKLLSHHQPIAILRKLDELDMQDIPGLTLGDLEATQMRLKKGIRIYSDKNPNPLFAGSSPQPVKLTSNAMQLRHSQSNSIKR